MIWGFFKLQEEMGELNTEMGKMGACPEGVHWDGKGHLYNRFMDEAADVTAAIAYVRHMNPEFNTPERDAEFDARVIMKLRKFGGWGLAGILRTPICAEKADFDLDSAIKTA